MPFRLNFCLKNEIAVCDWGWKVCLRWFCYPIVFFLGLFCPHDDGTWAKDTALQGLRLFGGGHTGLVWMQHSNEPKVSRGQGPDHISSLGCGCHVGADFVFKGGFYMAVGVGYTFPNASSTWRGSVQSPYLSSERICLRYTDNINIDMAGGWGKKIHVFLVLGASSIRERFDGEATAVSSGARVTFKSKTPFVWAPKIGLGTRFMMSEHLVMSLQLSRSFYGRRIDDKRSMWIRQGKISLAVKNNGDLKDLITQTSFSMGVSYALPIRIFF